MTREILTDAAFDTLFRAARTANGYLDTPVSDDLLKQIHDVMKYGPTSANSCPLRIVFVKTEAAKQRLLPALIEQNIAKVKSAPVTAIFAYDTRFHDHLPFLFPHTDARSWFEGNEKLIQETAFRNASLQAAYFMITARGFGLDCGPMSGFDPDNINAEFFADGKFRVNFICTLGHADHAKTFPRNPRFEFQQVCKIA